MGYWNISVIGPTCKLLFVGYPFSRLQGSRTAFFTCSNMEYVIQDLLVNSVVNLGAMLCGAVGCAVGAAAGCLWGGKLGVVVASAAMGFWSGLVAGGNAAGILSSGAKAILALWAEDPEPLRKTHPDIHSEFESRILSRIGQ